MHLVDSCNIRVDFKSVPSLSSNLVLCCCVFFLPLYQHNSVLPFIPSVICMWRGIGGGELTGKEDVTLCTAVSPLRQLFLTSWNWRITLRPFTHSLIHSHSFTRRQLAFSVTWYTLYAQIHAQMQVFTRGFAWQVSFSASCVVIDAGGVLEGMWYCACPSRGI